MKRKLEQAQQSPRKRKTKADEYLASRQRKETDNDDASVSEENRMVDNGKRAAFSRGVDDSALVLSSDDDGSSFDHENVTSKRKDEETTDYTVYGLLLEAYNNLRELGVALVVEEDIAPENEPKKDNSNTVAGIELSSEDEAEPAARLIRRSDHDVAADLMHAFHTLTRIQMQMKDSTTCPPFSVDDFIPCCRLESHPASKGKECALQAISVMDIYCTTMTDSQWDKLFPSAGDDAIRVGMRNRRHLVDAVLSSLSGEISDAWAVVNRSSRLVNTALHYEAPVDDEVADFVGNYGAKSQARLSALAERCLVAEVVTRMLYERGEYQEILDLLVRYVISSAPSIGVDDYPRLPPVMSLCVLESLQPPSSQPSSRSYRTNSELSWLVELQTQCPSKHKYPTFTLQGIALAIHTAAHVWKVRQDSSDDRISDVSRVELACYERLSKSQVPLATYPACKENLDSCRRQAFLLLQTVRSHDINYALGTTASRTVDASLAMQLALIIIGDMDVLVETYERSMKELDCGSFWPPVACCSAFRQLQARQIDSIRLKQGSLMMASSLASPSVLRQLVSHFDMLLEPNKASPDVFDMLVKCCIQLSDAESMYKVLLWLAKCDIPQTDHARVTATICHCFGSPFTEIRAPVVRVINLKRRHDRMTTFMAQAQSERILVSKAIARLDADDEQCTQNSPTSNAFDMTSIWGMHALNGQGGMVEVASRLSKHFGESRKLSEFVESHWRPNDLKAFDKDARSDEALVPLSPSECACALSHIASWKGVYRSLTAFHQSRDDPLSDLLFPAMISGYAHGKPLLHSNDHMPPTPVCVILEDDAILVDRFADRLSVLLEELPRDFQFCSIGYSRPKTAPIARYSAHLGIPSCIWYLTGYILSLEGAKHLLDSLPVKGPVDSWIGLKMCANWDNVFGQAIGVGSRSCSSTELPSRKDLARILKFRAFAALVPLCSQKVGTTIDATVGRSWRQRDTDVTYSGNL